MYYKVKLSILPITILLLLDSFSSFAQIEGIHLSWNGKEEVNTSKTMSITWMSPNNLENTIYYGVDSIQLNKRIKANSTYSNELNSFVFKADFKKLKPNFPFYYRVGSVAIPLTPTYSFRTAPVLGSKDKMVIGIWGDTQDNVGNVDFKQTDTIIQEMLDYPLQFSLHMGDMVENGSVVESWKGFYSISEPLNARIPLMSIVGNHDIINGSQEEGFQKPFPVFYQLSNLPKDQLNYSFDYGNTHFVAINSGYAQAAQKLGKLFFHKSSVEYKWLEEDLRKAKKNKKIKWIVLYCHYPLYSFGASNIADWKLQIQPLLDKYSVDLVLSGHRHVYERHAAINGDKIFSVKDKHLYENPMGTIYITNGSSGGSLQGVGGNSLPTMIYTPETKVYTYAIMSIDGKMINYEVYDKSGNRIDHFKIVKN